MTKRRVCAAGGTLLGVAVSALAAADLSIAKNGAGGVKPGGTIEYTIVVTNAGPDAAADVTVTDATPDGLTFASNVGDCTSTFPCDLGTVASGQTRTITAIFSVPAGYNGPNPIVNTASVITSSPDSDPSNNNATAFTAVTRVAGYHTLPPCRVADTRGSSGVPIGGPSLQAGASRSFPVRRLCGLPDNAISVSYNVTVTAPTGAGDLRIYPGATSLPLASAINYISGQTRANNGIVPLGTDGSIAIQCDQGSGAVDAIVDVNGFFASTDAVATPAGQKVKVRPAPEVEITFDNVTQAGVTSAWVIEFPDNRPGAIDQDLRDFFPVGSPERALLPSVVVPSFVRALGKGGPAGPPTFVLSLIDTTVKFTRTAEFHGLEDFVLGWDPPCVNASDRTQEPRTFYAREAPKGEPSLVEETPFGGPVFVDISSGCGSNKGSGWNFSLYLTAQDSRTPLQIGQYMLQRLQDALAALSALITNSTVATNLGNEVQAALTTAATAPASSIDRMTSFVGIVDANPGAFNDVPRNVSGELVGRAQSTSYMLRKLVLPGSITEFTVPTAGSFPDGIARGPDGNVWFIERVGSKVSRITPSGTVTEFALPASRFPTRITLGPDGNLWFTEQPGRIGRITPAGVITEFPVPASDQPWGIATGPDGNLWTAMRNGNKIRRTTPAGVFSAEFSIPTPSSGPLEIAAGPDGNLWFTEVNGNKIGRITPAGAIMEFPLPTPNSVPQGIAAGPDGNVWFTEASTSRIGRITPGGVITEFPAPGNPPAILTGPDGNLWFVEEFGNKVARITPAGVLTEFPIPTASSSPVWIATGPDGNLWFTESSANNIGRISP